jgi:hypothetical protein
MRQLHGEQAAPQLDVALTLVGGDEAHTAVLDDVYIGSLFDRLRSLDLRFPTRTVHMDPRSRSRSAASCRASTTSANAAIATRRAPGCVWSLRRTVRCDSCELDFAVRDRDPVSSVEFRAGAKLSEPRR